jgi:hypothetical protein
VTDTVPTDTTLLRDVIRWARANGWRYDGTGREKSWEREKDGYVIVGVEIARCHREGCDHDANLHVVDNGDETTTSASSIQRAVDVLVARGVLPARFSSAYAAGRASVLDEAEDRWAVMYDNTRRVRPAPSARTAAVYASKSRSRGFDVSVVHRHVTPWQAVESEADRG